MKSYQPLYLSHRPQTLGQLVGQQSVVKTLTNAIDNDRIAHAYLFTGPRGCGKTSSARILAKSLNCENGPTAEPCMTCSMCVEIKAGISPAVMELDAASNNSVDDARVIIERAPLVAQGGRFKLYIIDECHMLTKEAFNALLKTIEEPPDNVIFILATTEEHKVPPTIISRCQRLMFRLANHKELSEHLRKVADLEDIAILDEAIELIARRSGGGLRDALGLLDQASLLATKEHPVEVADLLTLLGAINEDVLLAISEGIRDRDGSSVLSNVHQLLAQGREPSLVALELSKHFLNLAKALHLGGKKNAVGAGESDGLPLINQLITGTQNYIDQVIKLAPAFEGAELTQMVEQLDRLEQNLRRSTQPALSLEVGLLALCHRHDILMVRELSARVEQLEQALAGGASIAPATTPHRPATTHSAPPQQYSAPPQQYSPPPQAPAQAEQSRAVEQPPARPAVVEERYVESQAEKHLDRHEQRSEERQAESAPAAMSPPPPQNTPAPASPSQISSHTSQTLEGSFPSEAIDEFWSNLMEYLQAKSIPTFSIYNQHGFALSLKEDEFVIGVRKEHFAGMLERKIDFIKNAVKTLTGKDMFIKVKVIGDEVGGRPEPARAASGRESESAGRSPAGRAPDEPGEPGRPPVQSAANFRTDSYSSSASAGSSAPTAVGYDQVEARAPERPANPEPKPQATPESRPQTKPESKPEAKSESKPKPAKSGDKEKKPWVPRDKAKEGAWTSGGPAKPAPDFAGSGENARGSDEVLMVKEAYKLFEGPGSRFIG